MSQLIKLYQSHNFLNKFLQENWKCASTQITMRSRVKWGVCASMKHTCLVSLLISFGSRKIDENHKDSSTVTCGEWISFCSTYPATLAKVLCSFLCPEILISPSIYPPVFLPAKTSRRVVFPAPLEPTSAVRTLGLNTPLTWDSNCSLFSATPLACISYLFKYCLSRGTSIINIYKRIKSIRRITLGISTK